MQAPQPSVPNRKPSHPGIPRKIPPNADGNSVKKPSLRIPPRPPGKSGQVPRTVAVAQDIRKLASEHLARRKQNPPRPPPGIRPPSESHGTRSENAKLALHKPPAQHSPAGQAHANFFGRAPPSDAVHGHPPLHSHLVKKPRQFVPPPPKSKPPQSGRSVVAQMTASAPLGNLSSPTAARAAAATLVQPQPAAPVELSRLPDLTCTRAPAVKQADHRGLQVVVEDTLASEQELAPTPLPQHSPQRITIPSQSEETSLPGFDEVDVETEQADSATPMPTANSSNMQQELLMLSTLGQGASGIVYKALHVPTMRMVAVKTIPVYDANKRATMVKELSALYSNLVSLQSEVLLDTESNPAGVSGAQQCISATPQAPCPYVVAFYDAFINHELGNLCMVVEYMDGGSLQDIIDTGGCANETILAQVSFRILKGLQFIHAHHQIHRDIKPANLLINHRGEVKVSDFGIVKDLESTQAMASTFVGTLTYMSPERISGESYGPNSDVWSLGLSIMTCALGRFPLSTSGGYWGIMHSLNEEPVPELPANEFSPNCCDFVARCLTKNPRERPSVDELLQHPFLVDCEEAILDQQREDFESHLVNESVELPDEEIASYEPPAGSWVGTENARIELDEICDLVMKHFCSELLNNALPGVRIADQADSLPVIGVKQAHSLARQLEVPNWLVRKRMLDARYVYSELLRSGAADEDATAGEDPEAWN